MLLCPTIAATSDHSGASWLVAWLISESMLRARAVESRYVMAAAATRSAKAMRNNDLPLVTYSYNTVCELPLRTGAWTESVEHES